MGLISWVIVGVIAALVANRAPNVSESRDKIINYVLGIIGALAGGFTTNLVMEFPVFDFSWASFFVAILGALVFLGIMVLIRR